jgi:glycine/D-amino acid oxidase-like deaminating enzyme
MQRHVVVVGNGVLGASASYHLTKLGARVTTLDPGTAAAATARSAGLVLHYSHPDKCRLVAQTVADVAALELELDEDLGFKRTGTLRVAVSAFDKAQLDGELAVMREFSAVSELTAAEVTDRVPWLELTEGGAGHGHGGDLAEARFVLIEADGFIDPVVLAGSFSRAARAGGATLVADAVQSLLLQGEGGREEGATIGKRHGAVCGVRTAKVGRREDAVRGRISLVLVLPATSDVPGLPISLPVAYSYNAQITNPMQQCIPLEDICTSTSARPTPVDPRPHPGAY